MSRKFGVEFIVLNRISAASGPDYDRFAKANCNPSAMKTAPVKHRCVRAKSGALLERLANACTGLWRELFTRASFLIGQGRKQGD